MIFSSSSKDDPFSRSFDGELNPNQAEKLVKALSHVQGFFLPRKDQKELDEKLKEAAEN